MGRLTTQEISDKQVWESFILSRPETNFLQSWEWGLFHMSLGKKVKYLALLDESAIVGAACMVKETARRGTYATVAGGPIIDWSNTAHVHAMMDSIKKSGREMDCAFIRFRPQIASSTESLKQLQEYGFLLSPMHLTADLTVILDITQSEEEILKQMRKTTRYEIRKAEKEGITVKVSENPDDLQEFYKHQLFLAKKHAFVPFSYTFLRKQFETFVQEHKAVLFHSMLEETLLASAFVIFYNQEAVYHYGISTPENSHLPGSYACQWAAIKEAKKRGMKKYNFWGVAPQGASHHRFSGVSIFKRGFGGTEVEFVPAHDIPLQWTYNITRFFETLRKNHRHL
jgi:lipid II:glycine glycyltransferase (peptidoglycan interpeptide bridge formation enzyme)